MTCTSAVGECSADCFAGNAELFETAHDFGAQFLHGISFLKSYL